MIEHGIPRHEYFAIAQPPSVAKPTVDSWNPDYVKPVFDFQDPKSKDKFQAELQDILTFTTQELSNANMFCLLTYGIEAKKLLKVLEKRYPEISAKNKVRFLLLKKI
ncbi:MAG TPA: hypothetical protein VFG54_12300 [Prolixibacteraceae bacterium]|nr:hypothetical protein [Prolixibacteraceae bacterium]